MALSLVATALLASVLLLAGEAFAQGAAGTRSGSTEWTLTGTTVLNAGRTRALREGRLTEGFELMANAASSQGEVVPSGTFRLLLSVFAPAADMPGQKKGRWYVRGTWTLAEPGAAPVGGRQSSGTLSGQVTGELQVDPTVAGAPWSARARLPFSSLVATDPQAGYRRVRGDGSIAFDQQLDGRLSLNLNLSPKL